MTRWLHTLFLAPIMPTTAVAVRQREIVVLQAHRRRGRIFVRRAVVEPLEEDWLEPSFEGKNVKAKEPLVRAMERALQRAGLRRARRWAAAIPSATSRVFLLELEEVPTDADELAAMIGWKVERLVGVASAELTIAAQRVSGTSSEKPRFLVVAARSDVVAAYEDLFRTLGLQVGFLIPNNLAESRWLATLPAEHDALLISKEGTWLTFFFARDHEPLAVRTIPCDPETWLEEVHRTLVYYQDRLSRPDETSLSTSADRADRRRDASDSPPAPETESPESAARESPSSPTRSEIARGSRAATLRSLVLVLHEEASPSLASQVQALCQTLFPPDHIPTLYLLNDQRLEDLEEAGTRWSLAHLVAPLGMVALP